MRNTIETKILKWIKLKTAVNKHLSDVLNAGEKRNAELINEYQKIFFEEESLLGKFAEIEPNMDFDYIKEEWVNLALLLDDNWMRDFKSCLNKITNDGVKAAFMQKIFDKVQGEIWSWAPYDNFSTECALPWNTNVISYFQTVVDYLTWKEGASHWKKTTDILKNIFISNEDINSALSAWEQIPMWTPLESSAISQDIRNAFDALLSFEIWKEADRAIDIAEDISDKLGWLFINSLPAINTIVWEDEVLKYDESRLWEEYKWELEVINNDTSLEDDERDKQINILRRKYYLQYLKSENKTIGETLQQLYDNDFDYSKIDTPALESYLDKVTDIRLRMLFTSRANEILKINFWNYS